VVDEDALVLIPLNGKAYRSQEVKVTVYGTFGAIQYFCQVADVFGWLCFQQLDQLQYPADFVLVVHKNILTKPKYT
jgi:hypothetical protein